MQNSQSNPSEQSSGAESKINADAERRERIAEIAYFLAERRGFSGDSEQAFADWLEAERQVDKLETK